MFFDLEPEKAIINDINISLMNFYRGVKNDFYRVKAELKNLQDNYDNNRKDFDIRKKQSFTERVEDKNEEIYYEMRDMFNQMIESKFHAATVYYYINKTAYSGMIRYNKDGKFNVPYGRYKNFNTDFVTEKHSELLNRCDIYSTDYKEIFNMADDSDFIFLDPPYDCVFSDYGNLETKDGFTEEMHRELAKDFMNLKAKALMVISKTPLIEELYGNMIIHEYNKSYAVNIRNRFKSEAKHVLITNF